jgi:hypothetical protein
LARFEFECKTFQWFYYLYLVRVENRVCLSHGVQVAGAAWRAAMTNVAGVGDLVHRIRYGRTDRVLSGRMIEWSSVVVCILHHARGDEKRGFLG